METSKALHIIYTSMNKLQGEAKARDYVSTSMFSAIYELQEEGLPVTAKTIEKKLSEKAKFCLQCEKKQRAA